MYRRFFKRFIDIAVSSAGILALSPLMAMAAVLIKLEDGGDVLFRQERVGKRGELFVCPKFRSMPMNADNLPSDMAAGLTVTRVGRILRRSNIDELPQLFAVLAGKMSLVGPRPPLPFQTELQTLRARNGAADCVPGLTGLAQVMAYDGMSVAVKAEWDGKYARSVSFLKDLKIIAKTIGYLTKKPPVY
jgi:O-antigen biosynthesis protein WbqP